MTALSLAAAFLLNGLVVATLAPRVLGRVMGLDIPALPALLAWVAALVSAAASAVGAAVAGGTALLWSGGDLHRVLVGCLAAVGDMFHGRYGAVLQVALVASAGLAVAGVGVLVGRLVVGLHRARARTLRHCRAAWLVGDSGSGPGGALLLDTPERAVYCVAGRRPAIVVTRGALDALDPEQLAAVLAHERAHLSGHHHLLVGASRTAAAVLPRLRLFSTAARAIAHLVEVRADELALRRSGRATLVSAMLALAGAGPLPSSALGASDVGLADRVERLLTPARAAEQGYCRMLGHATLALAAGPTVTAVAMIGVPLLCRTLFV